MIKTFVLKKENDSLSKLECLESTGGPLLSGEEVSESRTVFRYGTLVEPSGGTVRHSRAAVSRRLACQNVFFCNFS